MPNKTQVCVITWIWATVGLAAALPESTSADLSSGIEIDQVQLTCRIDGPQLAVSVDFDARTRQASRKTVLVQGRLVCYMVLFAIELATRKVEILGIRPQPKGVWMEQIARNTTGEGGFLAGKKYLIHDRDPLYTEKFDSILKAAGVEPVKLPARSPNLNAYAERFVRSIKEECLNQPILSSEAQLRYVLSEYLQHYHHERIHQGLNRIIDPQHKGNHGEIMCIECLGGLLKSYHRKAA